ncbi:MAG: carbon storage regulator [Planctomycetes bacterium]|nr:carbon storage regulator [Planctomycetota bacterium]
MLVLSRKAQQRIWLESPNGDQIGITICRIRRNGTVAVGIEAPDRYRIRREELLEKEMGTDSGPAHPTDH